jgi:hypothetical protein
LTQKIDASTDVVKKAAGNSRISDDEQLYSFFFLEPYLQLLKELNPGTHYNLDTDLDTKEFKRVAVVMPYVKRCMELDVIRPIFGLDVAHMKKIPLENMVLFMPMYLTVISCRTLDNTMLICSFAITSSESSADITFLIDTMKEGIYRQTYLPTFLPTCKPYAYTHMYIHMYIVTYIYIYRLYIYTYIHTFIHSY